MPSPLSLHLLFYGAKFDVARREPHQNGKEERSTFPPVKITPSFGAPPSGRFGRSRLATVPARSRGARATAEDGSMMIFMRSQTRRVVPMISSPLTGAIRPTSPRRIPHLL